jgi:hypothetical protein
VDSKAGPELRAKGRFLAAIFACGLLAAACGDDSGDESASTSPPSGPSGNGAPTISGTASGQVGVGAQYSFTPSASDPDGDSLTFSITNQPSWAGFDASTGRLSGNPEAGDVGTYASVRISVSDGTASASLPAFTVSVVAIGTGSATLSWTPPTENTDGSPLEDLAGYKIYWGPSQGNYTNSTSVGDGMSVYVVDGLTQGTWYFTATALNSAGIESTFSNAASKMIN